MCRKFLNNAGQIAFLLEGIKIALTTSLSYVRLAQEIVDKERVLFVINAMPYRCCPASLHNDRFFNSVQILIKVGGQQLGNHTVHLFIQGGETDKSDLTWTDLIQKKVKAEG